MIEPGIVNLELLLNNSLLYYGILMVVSMIAGILRGSMESNEAKNGNVQYKGMENLSLFDWIQDAGYGLIGAFIFLGTIQLMAGIPLEFMPTFGYAGRVLLINWGKKAEQTSIEQHK